MDDKIKKFQNEMREKMVGYIITALSLVAGLAWNDAIAALIQVIFPAAHRTVVAKIIYAVFITGLVIVVTIYLNNLFNRDEEDKN